VIFAKDASAIAEKKDPGTRVVVPDSDPSSYTTPSAFSPPSSGWIGVVPTEHGAPEQIQ